MVWRVRFDIWPHGLPCGLPQNIHSAIYLDYRVGVDDRDRLSEVLHSQVAQRLDHGGLVQLESQHELFRGNHALLHIHVHHQLGGAVGIQHGYLGHPIQKQYCAQGIPIPG